MKTIIITGSNSGIGRCAAHQIAAKGHRVILACRNIDAANATVQEIQKLTNNSEVYSMKVDLSSIAQVKSFIKEYASRFGKLDVLINNAADFDLSRVTPKMTDEGFESQFVTNLVAPVGLSEGLLDMLKSSDDGRIINISSQGLVVYPKIFFDFQNTRGEKKYTPSSMYYQTKLGLMMASLYQNELLKESNVRVYGIRVTNVKIDMKRYSNLPKIMKFMYSIKSKFSISADEMAKVYTELAIGQKREGFYYDEKLNEVKVNASAYDKTAQKRLIELVRGMIESVK